MLVCGKKVGSKKYPYIPTIITEPNILIKILPKTDLPDILFHFYF